MPTGYQPFADGGYNEMKMVAQGTISKGDFVEYDSTNGGVKKIASDGNDIFGVAVTDKDSDGYVMVGTLGVFKATAASGVDFKCGEEVYPKTDGTLYKGATGDHSCGRVVISDPSSGGTVYFVLAPYQYLTAVTHA